MSEAAAEPGFARLLSDERLTRRAVGGDQRAFAAIFRRYHQSLYRFCLTIVGNPEDAQDALQNTMAKVLRALPGEERRIELKPWLYRIAHNESIDLLRRRRETKELGVEQIAPGYGLAADAATRERLRGLIADMRELPERQRKVLVLRELAGLEFEEIGAALDTSGPVVRQTLYEARQSLRQMETGREMSCESVTKALSDGDGRVMRRRDVRAHLRSCAECRSFRDEIGSRQRDLAALSPLPALAAVGMLQGLVGGSTGAAGGGLVAALGGGAAKTIGASAAAKGVATAAVVAAVGVTAADRTGVIHLGLPGEPGAKQAPAIPGGVRNGASDGGGAEAGSIEQRAAVDAGRARGNAGSNTDGAKAQPALGEARAGRDNDVGLGRASGRDHVKAHAKPPGWGPGVEHAGGRGHEKQHPPAASNGQETAAAHQPPPREPDTAAKGGGKPAAAPQPVPHAPAAPSKQAPPAEPPAAAEAEAEAANPPVEHPLPEAAQAQGRAAEEAP
jgi:RNA polymerase sigma factor (sigma-70 family)